MYGLGRRLPGGKNELEALGAKIPDAAEVGEQRDANTPDGGTLENVQIVYRELRGQTYIARLVPLSQMPNPGLRTYTED